MEARGLVSSYDADKGEITAWGASEIPYLNRFMLATLLNFPKIGSTSLSSTLEGFGIRGEFYPEDSLIRS
jgi:carbon-monoxide dehydrogenase large subunit